MRHDGRLILAPIVLASALCGCGLDPVSITATLDDNRVLVGSATADGRFRIADDVSGLVCSGSFDPANHAHALVVVFQCSDGNVGTAALARSSDLRSGDGNIALADGTNGFVRFGSTPIGSARAIQENAGTPMVLAGAATVASLYSDKWSVADALDMPLPTLRPGDGRDIGPNDPAGTHR
jgi:hypothetical protein